MKKRILLEVAYDGEGFHGFALQDNARTVEGELNRAISDLTGRKTEVIGASRTDAGVHALKNIAVYDTEMNMEDWKAAYAINSRLPGDVRVRRSYFVKEDFHPRKCDTVKTYRYTILNDEFELPTMRRYSYFVHTPLDEGKMDRAAKAFVGEHDFKAFCSVHTQAQSTVRSVFSADVERNDSVIYITVRGGGFLYNMVRIIAGTLVDVGRGAISEDSIGGIIDSLDRTKAGPTAPPQGLCLCDIAFDPDPGRLSENQFTQSARPHFAGKSDTNLGHVARIEYLREMK